jgi:hypothetical protein
MSSLPFTLPEDLPAPVAFALFELFRDLTDALWQQYGHELIDLAMEERNQYLASQQEFDFNDDIPF